LLLAQGKDCPYHFQPSQLFDSMVSLNDNVLPSQVAATSFEALLGTTRIGNLEASNGKHIRDPDIDTVLHFSHFPVAADVLVDILIEINRRQGDLCLHLLLCVPISNLSL